MNWLILIVFRCRIKADGHTFCTAHVVWNPIYLVFQTDPIVVILIDEITVKIFKLDTRATGNKSIKWIRYKGTRRCSIPHFIIKPSASKRLRNGYTLVRNDDRIFLIANGDHRDLRAIKTENLLGVVQAIEGVALDHVHNQCNSYRNDVNWRIHNLVFKKKFN